MKNTINDPNIEKKAKRVHFYVTKLAEFTKMRPSNMNYELRKRRLQQYKKLLNEYLNEQ